jgi:hypothetical protein
VIAVPDRGLGSPDRVRYARASQPEVWLEAPRTGFVGAIVSTLRDGVDRVVWAWPARPDNGFVTAAVGLREARAVIERATVVLWPWRSAATHAARSILVHAEDVAASAGRRAPVGIERPARREDSSLQVATESLCMVELRLNDLLRSSHRRGQPSPATTTDENSRHPTLLETTSVFPPMDARAPAAYERDPHQVLRRVRRYTTLETIPDHVARIGDPVLAPFAAMGLPSDRRDVSRCLAHERFARQGIDVIVVDLTRGSRTGLSADWRRDLQFLLDAVGAASLPRRPPVVALCDEGFVMHGADAVLARSVAAAIPGRRHVVRSGAVVLRTGIFATPGAAPVPELPPLPCDADVKDASLRPLRERLITLARSLRESGQAAAAVAVGSALRVVSAFASLPLGISEAKSTALVLFDGDGREDVKARSLFYPSSRLQRMADAAAVAPEFAADIRAVLEDLSSHIAQWDGATPVSLKLRSILADPAWNARDVLLVLPDTRTTDVFLVSDSAIDCGCTVIDGSTFAEHAETGWRRIIIVRPDSKAVRGLLTLRNAPTFTLLLGDSAGAVPIAFELEQIASISDFAPFARRARALADALRRGGADAATIDIAEPEFHYRLPTAEDFIDLAQAADDYAGPTVRLRLESGARAAYRPGGDVLLFTPDATRAFTRVEAQDVRTGDSILVLRKDIRDRLSDALLRSRKTAAQLKVYHERVAAYRRRLAGATMRAKAREVLGAMRAIDPLTSEHEIPNIIRWLSVEPSDAPQQPRAARDRRRFRLFVQAVGLDTATADAFWDHAILPVRAYSAVEGHVFNRRIVQFVIDPEGVAAGVGWSGYRDLWQAVVDSVERVTDKEVTHG